MNVDIKLKTHEQLQQEVITLNTNSYLKDLKIKQLQSNWNSLREWLEEQIKHYSTTDCQKEVRYEFLRIADKFTSVLDKMNELEGEDNEEKEKKIEKLNTWYGIEPVNLDSPTTFKDISRYIDFNTEMFFDKINEIIDKMNELEGDDK